jgi:sulfate transport system substrate-binding protein
VKGVFANVPVLDTGARGATTTFAERGIGDVLIAWESDALLVASRADLDLVVPSSSILAETPVAVVDKYVDKHGTRAVAEAYVKFLYGDEARALALKHGFRPAGADVLPDRFAKVELFTIDDAFGGWAKAQATHFAEHGVFDQLVGPQP